MSQHNDPNNPKANPLHNQDPVSPAHPAHSSSPDEQNQPQVLANIPMGPADTDAGSIHVEPATTLPVRPVHEGEHTEPASHAPQPHPANAGAAAGQKGDQAAPPAQTDGPYSNQGAGGISLPRKALIVMRRSGGLRFTSSTITVFRDGHVEHQSTTVHTGAAQQPASLSDEQLAELYRALDAAEIPKLRSPLGHQNPDGYAYELAARIGGEVFTVEAFDGAIPDELGKLIQLLSSYEGH